MGGQRHRDGRQTNPGKLISIVVHLWHERGIGAGGRRLGVDPILQHLDPVGKARRLYVRDDWKSQALGCDQRPRGDCGHTTGGRLHAFANPSIQSDEQGSKRRCRVVRVAGMHPTAACGPHARAAAVLGPGHQKVAHRSRDGDVLSALRVGMQERGALLPVFC